MRNLLEFIVKHSNLLIFVLLEIAAVMLIVSTHPYQYSRVITGSHQVVAGINDQGDRWHNYFHLHTQNQQLVEQNAQLLEQLSALQGNDFSYTGAKVIDMTIHSPHNHFIINKGAEDSICEGMGVSNVQGAIGIVSQVGKHYAVCVPILHTQNHLSCRLKKNRYVGFTSWSGVNSRYVELTDVARHVSVEVGDTVVTSGLTTAFEEDVPVGVVDRVKIGDGDNYQKIRVRLMVDYHQLEYVQVGQRHELD